MKIEINRMECYARHGVLPLENKVGAPFRVSLTLFVPDAACAGALRDDRLEDTVNYAEVTALVRHEMALPSQLIEHVAERIASAVLKEFRKVNEVTVKIEKLSPPIAGFSAEGVSVELVKRRPLFVFDFDGTIADTRADIVRTMQASFRTMHLPVPKAEEIVPTIGLPLTESIAKLGNLQGERLEQTVETYRRLFEEVGVEGIALRRNGRMAQNTPQRGRRPRHSHQPRTRIDGATLPTTRHSPALCRDCGV